MEIKTKYSVGQDVWLLYDNQAVCQVVNKIYTTTEMKAGNVQTTILYDIQFTAGGYKEQSIFESKESLIQSL